jgi:hypothetical protein
MMYFQGSWYCTQCGYESYEYKEQCHLCLSEEFQSEPLCPKDDIDQLSEKDLEHTDFNVGNF